MIQLPNTEYANLIGERDAFRQALERIWNAGHPNADAHCPELRGLSEAAFGEHLVLIAGHALGRIDYLGRDIGAEAAAADVLGGSKHLASEAYR